MQPTASPASAVSPAQIANSKSGVFSGASGLFSVVLKPIEQKKVYAFMDELALFGMGYSWGGFESLVISFDCNEYRTATQWNPGGPTLRFHIGLEDTGDLIADLESGFAAMARR
jgi:cystathionine beta-lyase